jgi:hypothetical protein
MAYVVTKNPDNSIKFFNSDSNSEINLIAPTFNWEADKIFAFGNFGKWERTLHEIDFTSVGGQTATTLEGWYDLLVDMSSDVPSGLSPAVTCFFEEAQVLDESPVIDLGMNDSVVLFGNVADPITVDLYVSSDGVSFFPSGLTYTYTSGAFYFASTNINTRYVKYIVSAVPGGTGVEAYIYAQSK